MADEDDAAYRHRISQILDRHGFGWVIEQTEAQIAEGKPSSKQVSERESRISLDSDFTIARPRSRRASLITSEPYTESERLAILLKAIEAAIVQRSALEQAVLEEVPGVSRISFEPDSLIEEATAFSPTTSHRLDSERGVVAIELEKEAKAALARMRERDSGDT